MDLSESRRHGQNRTILFYASLSSLDWIGWIFQASFEVQYSSIYHRVLGLIAGRFRHRSII